MPKKNMVKSSAHIVYKLTKIIVLGVMLSHRNLISAMSSLINIAQFKPNDRYIGYLPLAHVLELLAETSCLLYGIKVGYR